MLAAALLLILPATQAIFFGGGGGGGCGCCCAPPAPVCAPAPACAPSYPVPSYQPVAQYQPPPAPAYIAPAPQGYALPAKKRSAHGVRTGTYSNRASPEEQMLAETEGLRRRVRRDTEAAFDPKCNSELLKEIILENMDGTTAVAKRQIQEAATKKLGGRIDVVCSTGTFSYIVNTELYCETEKNGTTCFAFRQSS